MAFEACTVRSACLQVPAGTAQGILSIRRAEGCALNIIAILNHGIVVAAHLPPVVSLQQQSMQLMLGVHCMLHLTCVVLAESYLHHFGRQATCQSKSAPLEIISKSLIVLDVVCPEGASW